MPTRDAIHDTVVNALLKDGWRITDDPLALKFGGRHVQVDLGAISDEPGVVGLDRDDLRIAVEIKTFFGPSPVNLLEQAIGRYVIYNFLLEELDPGRILYLAIPDTVFAGLFSEALAGLVVERLPMRLLVIDCELEEVFKWLPAPDIETS